MRSLGAALLVLCLAACEAEPEALVKAAPAVDAADLLECGIPLKPGAARAYFERLAAALDSGAPIPMTFYDDEVVIGSHGRHLRFRTADFQPGAAALLSNVEWREIADRGVADLDSIGWRGCILGDGRAWFQATADGELALSGFDKDRPWVTVPQDRAR